MSQKPKIMVSSTFYDLRQVRADLVPFLADDLGFDVLASETLSFPVEPDVEAIENCLRRVERDADILVLIIGARYGYVDPASKKSVTNLEYLAARAKGLPVYTFIEKRVLSALPIFRDNSDGCFDSVVDDVRIFDFIEEVRSEHRNWCFEFEVAQEIIQALRQQLAYLTHRALIAHRRLSRAPRLAELNWLSGEALTNALTKGTLWEYRLFASALIAEVDARREIRRRHQLGIVLGQFHHVEAGQLTSWITERMAELSSLISSCEISFNVDLKEAVGAEGEHGNPELLAFCARSIGCLYEELIEWSLRWRRISIDERWSRARDLMTHAVDDMIADIERYGPRLQKVLVEIDEEIAQGKKPVRNVTLTLNLSGMEEISQELESIRRQIELEAS